MSPSLRVRSGTSWLPVSGEGPIFTNAPPSTPTGLTATAGSPSQTSVVLTWSAGYDPDGSVVSYQVRVNGVLKGTPTSPTLTITGLTAATSYTATVRAIDDDGAMSAEASLGFSTASPSTGWPDAESTGAHGTLSAGWDQYDFYGATDGQVFENYEINITAPMEFDASHAGRVITFRNCIFLDGGVYRLVLNEHGAILVFEDCTFICGGADNPANAEALNGSDITTLRCNIYNGGDGIKAGVNVKIYDTWIHDLYTQEGSHNDCVQIMGTQGDGTEGSGVHIRGSRLDAQNGATCITLSTGSAWGMKDILVEENLLYCNGIAVTGGYQAGVDNPDKVSNIIYRDNKVKYPSGSPIFTSVDSPVVVTGTTWFDGPNAGEAVS